MKHKRKTDELNQFLLDKKEINIFRSLKKKLKDYVEILNLLFKNKNIKYTVMLIDSSEKSIEETVNYIRRTDIFFKIPYKKNQYLVLLQNTDSKSAIAFASRLTSLINRFFMINKKNITHKVSIISIETKTLDITELIYEIIYLLRKFNNSNIEKNDDYWVEIKRF